MLERLSAHEPLLVNTIGHSVGAILFALFLYMVRRDPGGVRLRASRLSIAAAALAFVWNAASVAAIGGYEAQSSWADLAIGIATTALNLLPAVLLHIALGIRHRMLASIGYTLSFIAIGIHWGEFVLGEPEFHRLGLRFTTVSFAALTAIAAVVSLRSRETERDIVNRRLFGIAALFLFALSFVHFGFAREPWVWPFEVLVHHAGIPLALFVLLQDFRFLLLDAFIRVFTNLAVAGATIGLVLALGRWAGVEYAGIGGPFRQGILIVGAALALVTFAAFRERLQGTLTRILFRRTDLDEALAELRTHEDLRGDEEYLDWAVRRIARYLEAECHLAGQNLAACLRHLDTAGPILAADAGDCREALDAAGAEVAFPLRLSSDEVRYYLLGRRPGGRPYLSEDIQALARLTAEVVDHVKHYRDLEMRRLVSQAELRALQAQIHPHFLFNALNTLYGAIPRQARGARDTVLNLADILRYFLQSGKTFIPLEEELKIVRAYLEIEQLRLGDRLRATVDADPATLSLPIPMLTIQPLVENAVKHGVSARAAGGDVAVQTRIEGGRLKIRVRDNGPGFAGGGRPDGQGHGVGLDNVRGRLRLCYGEGAGLDIESGDDGTTAGFSIPARERAEVMT